MPKLAKTLYDVSDKDANNAADQERKDRTAMIDRYWAYYWGNHTRFLSIDAGRDHNVTLNLCQMAIDKKIDFTASDALIVSIPTDADPATQNNANNETVEPNEAILQAWLEDNEFESFFYELLLSGFVSGHTFIKYYIDNDAYRFALLDPREIVAFWKRGIKREAAWYNIQWSEGDTNYRQDIVPSWMFVEGADADLPADYWVIIDYYLDRGNKWVELSRDVWEHPFAPILQWPNKVRPFQFYGDSELTHYALNDAVNFLASNNNKIIYYHGSPRVVAKDIIMPRDPMTGEQVQGNPNDIIEIGANGEMYLLEPNADLVASMNLLDKFQQMFFTQAKVVDLATIQDKLGQITNFGVKMIFSDALADVRKKQKLYGKGLQWLMAYGMELLGRAIPLPIIQWPDPLPENMLEKAQIAQIEKNIGTASTQTLSEELGHDWATEEERLAVDAELSASALDRVMQGQGQFLGDNGANGSQP